MPKEKIFFLLTLQVRQGKCKAQSQLFSLTPSFLTVKLQKKTQKNSAKPENRVPRVKGFELANQP